MPCEQCEDGYIGCAPGGVDACSDWGEPDEDKCHAVKVYVMEQAGKCTARLCTGAGGPPTGEGWTLVGDFKIRVQAGKVQNKCAAKVFLVDNDCDDEDVAQYDTA